MLKLKNFLSSRKLTILLVISLVAVTLFSWLAAQSRASTTSNIVYFIPGDSDLIEPEVLPSVFKEIEPQSPGFLYVNGVDATSDWAVVRKHALKTELDVLIIHHAAQDAVNWEEVQDWFQRDNLVVAGIGLAGDKLAELLGAPGLFIQQGSGEMKFDYFVYSVHVSGQPEDEQKVIDTGFISGDVATIQEPLSVGGSASRGFLFERQSDITKFLGTLDAHLIEKAMDKENE